MDVFNLLPFAFDDFLLVIKGFYLLGLFLYLLFAVLVIKQITMMKQSLGGVLTLPLMPIAVIHFLVAVGVFLGAAVFL